MNRWNVSTGATLIAQLIVVREGGVSLSGFDEEEVDGLLDMTNLILRV